MLLLSYANFEHLFALVYSLLLLNPFLPYVPFSEPPKIITKPSGFVIISGSVERKHSKEMS